MGLLGKQFCGRRVKIQKCQVEGKIFWLVKAFRRKIKGEGKYLSIKVVKVNQNTNSLLIQAPTPLYSILFEPEDLTKTTVGG